MTFTNYVATKDLFQALIRAKRGVRPPSVEPPPMPTVTPCRSRALTTERTDGVVSEQLSTEPAARPRRPRHVVPRLGK